MAPAEERGSHSPMTIGHHLIIQTCDSPTSGTHAERRHEAVQEARGGRVRQRRRERKCTALMLPVALPYGVRVLEKQPIECVFLGVRSGGYRCERQVHDEFLAKGRRE
jgi:hypothetical protein